jgi:hypothetical protein
MIIIRRHTQSAKFIYTVSIDSLKIEACKNVGKIGIICLNINITHLWVYQMFAELCFYLFLIYSLSYFYFSVYSFYWSV